MTTPDIILLICFVPAIVGGLSKGFIRQCVNIIALVAGVWAAFRFSEPLGEWLAAYFTLDEKVMHVLSFAAAALLAVFVLNLIGGLIGKALDSLSLGWLDKLLGLVLSLLKTALILGIVIVLFETLNAKWELVKPEAFDGATLYAALKDAALKVLPFLKELISNIPNEISNV